MSKNKVVQIEQAMILLQWMADERFCRDLEWFRQDYGIDNYEDSSIRLAGAALLKKSDFLNIGFIPK